MKVQLSVVAGPHQGRSFTFEEHDTFIVGRASYAHFRLSKKDAYFSRAHFMVEINPPLCHLMDMASSNGTFVNKKKVREAHLKNGDLIQGGDTEIRVEIEKDDQFEPTRRAYQEASPEEAENPARQTLREPPSHPPRKTQIENI